MVYFETNNINNLWPNKGISLPNFQFTKNYPLKFDSLFVLILDILNKQLVLLTDKQCLISREQTKKIANDFKSALLTALYKKHRIKAVLQRKYLGQ